MSEIFSGMLCSGRARQRAQIEAEKAEILSGGNVTIVTNSKEFATNGILFESGIRAIVYIDGNNIGVIRHNNVEYRMDDDVITAVVTEIGEINEWFAHPAGFLFCRGSRKDPVFEKSNVDPKKLAQAVNSLFE